MLPITYSFDFQNADRRLWSNVMREFATNGAKHLVLGYFLISEIMKSFEFGKKLKQAIQSAGLSLVDSHAPFGPYLDLNVPDPYYRNAMLEHKKLALRIAADFGIDSMAMHVGDTPAVWRSSFSLKQMHEALNDSLEKLLPLAEQLGVVIAIEGTWCASNTAEKNT